MPDTASGYGKLTIRRCALCLSSPAAHIDDAIVRLAISEIIVDKIKLCNLMCTLGRCR